MIISPFRSRRSSIENGLTPAPGGNQNTHCFCMIQKDVRPRLFHLHRSVCYNKLLIQKTDEFIFLPLYGVSVHTPELCEEFP